MLVQGLFQDWGGSAKANGLMTMYGPIQQRVGHTLTSSILFPGLVVDAKTEGLVWHDQRATYKIGRGRIQCLRHSRAHGPREHFHESALRSHLPVGAGEAVMLKTSGVKMTVTIPSQVRFLALWRLW